jgi:undecaprenyl-diphosphatase
MDTFIIFCAKYLIWLELAAVAGFILWRIPWREWLTFVLPVLPVSFIAARALSLVYWSDRPFTQGTQALLQHAADNGFPSDHMLLAGTLAAIVLYYDRLWGAFFFAVALLVGMSRVAAGVHSVLDIIASAVVALCAIGVVHLARSYFLKRSH